MRIFEYEKVEISMNSTFLFTFLLYMLVWIESVEFDWFTLIFSHQPPAEIFTNWLYFWNILKIGFDRCFCYFANISFSFFFFLNFWQLRFRFAKICIVRKYNKIQNVHVLKIVKIYQYPKFLTWEKVSVFSLGSLSFKF